jgi:phosphonate transport system substrate-binding protein
MVTELLNKIGNYRLSISIVLLAVIILCGYLWWHTSEKPRLTMLRVAVLPDEDRDILQRRYAPLISYLSREAGIETTLLVPENYGRLLRLFGENQVDLAYFGGLTFVQAQSMYEAQPLVMREIDTHFTSWFLTRPEHADLQLSDFGDKRFSFGSDLSTSGHLMPRHFLSRQWDIDPEQFFSSVEYSGAHDKSVITVLENRTDLAAVNSAVVRSMIASGRIDEQKIHVTWQSPPYSNYVWAVRADLDEALKIRLRDLFLRLEAEKPADREILNALGARVLLPANPADFAPLAGVAADLELMHKSAK